MNNSNIDMIRLYLSISTMDLNPETKKYRRSWYKSSVSVFCVEIWKLWSWNCGQINRLGRSRCWVFILKCCHWAIYSNKLFRTKIKTNMVITRQTHCIQKGYFSLENKTLSLYLNPQIHNTVHIYITALWINFHWRSYNIREIVILQIWIW